MASFLYLNMIVSQQFVKFHPHIYLKFTSFLFCPLPLNIIMFDFLVLTLSFQSWSCLWITSSKSSAYNKQLRDWFPYTKPGQLFCLKYCGKSFINKENKTGLKPSPCLIPLLQENWPVSVLWSILTQLLIEEYMDLMIFRTFPWIPYLCNFWIIPNCHTLSKAFS